MGKLTRLASRSMGTTRNHLVFQRPPGEYELVPFSSAWHPQSFFAIEGFPLDDLGQFEGTLPPGASTTLTLVRKGSGLATTDNGGRLSGQLLTEFSLEPGEHRTLQLDATTENWPSFDVHVRGADSPCSVHVLALDAGGSVPAPVTRPLRPDGIAGPFRVPRGQVRLWLSGPDWADTSRPTFVASPEMAPIEIDLTLDTRRVRVLRGGAPVAGARIRPLVPTSPGGPTVPALTADDDGWITLRLAPGKVLLGLDGSGLPAAEVQWPDVEVLEFR